MTASPRTFVGFGFGPIQSALFCYEARQSGNFSRLVVAEIDATLVDAVRAAGGRCAINIAHADRIEQATIEGVELLNPREPADRENLLAAICEADEMATALPSVGLYQAGGDASVVRLLNAGLAWRDSSRPAVLYAAENHNHAAEVLTDALSGEARQRLQVVNTVIGKMSGVIDDPAVIDRLGLATITPHTPRAVLVEAFNRILVSRIEWPGFARGIEVFQEKADLLPFEEAKLYGHNAIHALIGYMASRRGLVTMDQAADDAEIMATARAAFLDESGASLGRKYADLGDDLFTPAGYARYAEDLLARMTTPHLNDLVARVVRDPQRKCGYQDRLFGTMRLAVAQGFEPVNMARGAAAAAECLNDGKPLADRPALAKALHAVWGGDADEQADHLIDLTWRAMQRP